MALEAYREKRDFTRTTEPRGKPGPPATGHRFVVQKHAARRLHYDLRLELDGVLKSWAVTKGPSLVPGTKRLAVEVEDHPLDYAGFEGTIPTGSYGAGSVIVWDRGTWVPASDPHEGLAKGHLEFELQGTKLHGRWHLVRLHPKPRDKRRNWLLIKADDVHAREPGDPDLLEAEPQSVPKHGRPRPSRTADRKATAPVLLPDFVPPLLAAPARRPPSGSRWLHEIKLDGYRIQARVAKGATTLRTRSGLDWTGRFGRRIPAALASLPLDSALIDGEIVVVDPNGASSFASMQAALSNDLSEGFVYYAFDLLVLDGKDLRRLPLVDRKAQLQGLLPIAGEVLRFSEHFDESGRLVLHHACRLSLEGVVSKRRDSPYRSGRSRDWLKSKCADRQEFIVTGYVPSSVSGQAIGALALGYREHGRLRHAGRVGTGFDVATARRLFARLEPLRIDGPLYDEALSTEEARGLRFVRPELVAEVEFRNWTADRRLRHATFRGLRDDKPASEIVRENVGETVPTTRATSFRLTHPDRVYWPDAGVTKAGLASYYADVWRWLAPYVTGRPLALVRCPGGIQEKCFFQKHAWKGIGRVVRVSSDPQAPEEQLLSIDDLDGMVALVQAGVLELHPWGATLAALEEPDTLVLDLDPGEDAGWPLVLDAAREIRERLLSLGLAAFVKSSGGKGLHVVTPLVPKAGWPALKTMARRLAAELAADSPDRFTATMSKAKRRGRVFVDYLRNARGATAVAPYSTRARPGAPVAMPLAWDELADGIGPATFTVSNTASRLRNLATDPWPGFRDAAVPLPASARRRGRSS